MKNINFQNRKMFTLIELLVVIAIIAILAAILLPALNSARERGRDADCKSQLKQLATAEEFYCSDFDDFITPLRSKFPGFAEWSYAALLWKQGYLGVTSLFICPSMADFQYDTEVRNQTFSKSAPYQLNWISYGINAAVGSEIYISQGQVEGPAYKRGKVLAPSQTFLFPKPVMMSDAAVISSPASATPPMEIWKTAMPAMPISPGSTVTFLKCRMRRPFCPDLTAKAPPVPICSI